MMGRNKLILCSAEMNRAIEYYLNEKQFKEYIKVFSVCEKSENGSPVFEVTLSPVDIKVLLGETEQEEL